MGVGSCLPLCRSQGLNSGQQTKGQVFYLLNNFIRPAGPSWSTTSVFPALNSMPSCPHPILTFPLTSQCQGNSAHSPVGCTPSLVYLGSVLRISHFPQQQAKAHAVFTRQGSKITLHTWARGCGLVWNSLECSHGYINTFFCPLHLKSEGFESLLASVSKRRSMIHPGVGTSFLTHHDGYLLGGDFPSESL